ncbi:LysR family transcriptional regulator [Vogesella sp. LIG4]|uniref:LysR family transcriptional regulator n=1 Tax=Vogesella sp. LIG4 TaxID=1192162 RepID=UPI00081F8FA3|nr:LysR family transcriptional regulator [Vogesella sp. LIG4]SCK22593.1 DNA-binding transcriptional regulator, LysR family [Vogesella sp. LIG4]
MLNNLHDLDLRLIRVFLAVVEAGGVTPAQSALNVSQSTISIQLSTLETRLGFRLCERGRGGFSLTAKGENFVISARRLLLAIDDFCVEARHMGKRLVGSINLGLIGNTPVQQNIRISQAIARFRQRDEAVKFSVQVRPPGDLEEQVLNGQLHLAVGYFWHRLPSLEYTPLFVERQVAYCGQGHPLFECAGALESGEVADYDWAWRGYPLPEAQHATSQRHVTAVADNMEAIAVLLLSGFHLGYLPEHFATPYVEQGLLRALNPQQLHYSVTFHVLTRREPQRGDILKAFLEDLRSEYL